MRSVCFTDSITGWAAGDSGVIIRTADGGDNWTLQGTGIGHPVVDIFFLNDLKGWAIAQNYTALPYGTLILATEDGGNVWTLETYPEENLFMNCILFLDPLNGWMGGSPHAIVRTNDGGLNWEQASVDTSTLAFFPVLSIHFWDYQYGYASGGMFDIAGVTWRTSDGGDSWQAIDPSDAPADEVHELYLFDSTHVMGIGGDPDFAFGAAVIRTFDGGINWEYDELGLQGTGYDIDFRNGEEAWAPMGPQQTLIYSLDGGETWTPINSPDNSEIFDITFPDSLHGYAVGRQGAFLSYKPPVGVSVMENGVKSPPLTPGQNFPNPFSGSTIITYQLSIRGTVKLEVFDTRGMLIRTVIDGPKQPGGHKIVFDGAGLPQGLYFYRLDFYEEGGRAWGSSMKKMVMTR